MEERPTGIQDSGVRDALHAWGIDPVTWQYAPVGFDDTPAEILEGVPQVIVAPDGSLTAVWSEYGPERNSVKAVDKPAGATGWTAPRTLSAPTSSASGVRAGKGPDGDAVLVWTASDETEGTTALEAVVRPAGSTEWGPIETAGPVDNALVPQPLVAPNGEITLVWVDWRDTYGVSTVTRSTSGEWSAVTCGQSASRNRSTSRLAPLPSRTAPVSPEIGQLPVIASYAAPGSSLATRKPPGRFLHPAVRGAVLDGLLRMGRRAVPTDDGRSGASRART